MPRVLTDQDFNEDIIRGLARRVADLDWMPLRRAGNIRSRDAEVLRIALADDRILLSHDAKTLHPLALRLIAEGSPVPRVVVVPKVMAWRIAIDELELLLLAGTERDWGVGVVRLPLPSTLIPR
ncbi:MAG: hypothetical protein ACRDHF_08430 [Tepidiformaceae bacterium]